MLSAKAMHRSSKPKTKPQSPTDQIPSPPSFRDFMDAQRRPSLDVTVDEGDVRLLHRRIEGAIRAQRQRALNMTVTTSSSTSMYAAYLVYVSFDDGATAIEAQRVSELFSAVSLTSPPPLLALPFVPITVGLNVHKFRPDHVVVQGSVYSLTALMQCIFAQNETCPDYPDEGKVMERMRSRVLLVASCTAFNRTVCEAARSCLGAPPAHVVDIRHITWDAADERRAGSSTHCASSPVQ